MDISTGTAFSGATAAQANSMQKDVAGAQLITKTLDRLNTTGTGMGAKVDQDYQFQKDVLNAAGIGNKLDTVA